ncbi:MAG: PopZ family protein [Pseudorhodoplanes sp.]|uniref:PopZ family protein n=1 Tax=Pseudorhodoplanes sp. TaxID=1934341 RepID=UPI003D13EACB
MNQPVKSHEPSMEEILASIRRIIADDDAKVAVPDAAAEASPPPVAAVAPVPPPVQKPSPPSPMEFLRDIPPASPPSPPPSPPPVPAAQEESADILELTEAMRAPDPEPPVMRFTTVEAQADVVFAEPPPQAENEPEPEPEMETAEPPIDHLEAARLTLSEQLELDRPLLSRSASAAVDSAFATLTHTVLSQNARTLDDLVKEMLRPMLKSWLDDNLPSLVERLVRAEIERVSRGR